MDAKDTRVQTAVFGGGCFWCTEAVFKMIHGVISVTPGYAGGRKINPTYEEVCTGSTGHAEVVLIEFDPAAISYMGLLSIFFAMHDPTVLNRQGNDVGPQYRSLILYTTEEQKAQAEASIHTLTLLQGRKIITELKPLDAFFRAEVSQQDYYARNPQAAYCALVIDPKVRKIKEKFANHIK